MAHSIHKKQSPIAYRILCTFIAVTFGSSVILPPAPVFAQTVLNLPVPGMMVAPSPGFMPVQMTGLTIYPDNPLRFDFIMDTGHSGLDIHSEEFKQESAKLIKYFMASLTTPEEELWVNLSPYEKDRMIPADLGKTEMGRDMLAQDYLLKQLTASLMYPEQDLGKEFWKRVYQKAREKFGTTEIPVNTFNKVWIVPDEALVYEQGTSAFVIKSRLAVMLEEDYNAMNSNVGAPLVGARDRAGTSPAPTGNNLSIPTQIIREVILPAIEQEINEGKNFASLRQIYNALILATWYKQRLKDSLLGKVYVDQNKTKGIDTQDKGINQKIYGQYIESFKKGVYNFIKEDYDSATQEIIPRKYFSGGMAWKLGGLKTVGALALGTLLSFGSPDFGNASALAAAAMGGNKAGVTAEFVENSPNDVTVTVHNGENVRPVLLAQAAPLSMKKQGQGSRVKGQGFSIDKDASSPVGDGAGKQESGLDLFLRKLRGLNADESQMGFSQGMDGSFVWSDGLERGMRIIFDQEKRTIRLKSQQHGEYFEFLQAPEFTRVKTFQWEVKVGGVYLVSIGYHKGNRPEDNHLYLILRDGAERKLLAAKKQEAAGLKAELEERYLGNPETTVDSHQSERAAVLGDKLEQAIPHGEDLGELLSLMQEVQKFLRGDNVDNEGFVLNPGIYLKIKRRMQNEGGMRWWPGDISIFSESEFKELAGKDTSLVTIFSNKPRSRAQEPENIDNLDAVEIPLTMDVADVLDIFGDPYSTHAERHQALGLGDSVELYQFGYEILLPWLIQQDETILKRFIRERLRHEIVVPVPAISPHQEYNTIATFVLSTYEAARESSEDSRERFEKAMVELLDEAVERAKDMPGSLPREEEDYIYWLLHILDRVHSPSVVPVLEKTVREGVLNVFSPKINAEILRNFLGLPHSLSRAELMAGFGRENESIGLLFRNVYELSKSHSLFLLPGFLRLRLGESARGIYFLEDFFKEEHDIKEAVAPLSEEEKAELSRELREVWEAVKIALDNRPRIQLHSSASEELRKMVEEVPKEEEAASRKIEDILRALDDGNFAREVRSDGGSTSSPVMTEEEATRQVEEFLKGPRENELLSGLGFFDKDEWMPVAVELLAELDRKKDDLDTPLDIPIQPLGGFGQITKRRFTTDHKVRLGHNYFDVRGFASTVYQIIREKYRIKADELYQRLLTDESFSDKDLEGFIEVQAKAMVAAELTRKDQYKLKSVLINSYSSFIARNKKEVISLLKEGTFHARTDREKFEGLQHFIVNNGTAGSDFIDAISSEDNPKWALIKKGEELILGFRDKTLPEDLIIFDHLSIEFDWPEKIYDADGNEFLVKDIDYVLRDKESASSPVTAQEEYSYYQKAFPGLIRQDPEGKYYIMHNLISYFLPKQKQALAVFPSEDNYESLRNALSLAREEILDSLTINEIENFDVLYAFLMAHQSIPTLQRTIETKEIIDTIDTIRRGKFVEERDLRIMDVLPGVRKKVNELLTASQDNEHTANKQKPSLEEVLKKFVPGEAVILRMTDILPGKQSSIPPGSIMVGFLENDINEGNGIVLSNGGWTSNIKRIMETMDASALMVQTDTSTYEIKILTEITDRLISGERKLQKGDILGRNNFNVVGIVTDLDSGSGTLELRIHTKDEVSKESAHSRYMQDRITLGEYRAWEIAASSPAVSQGTGDRVQGTEIASNAPGGIDLNPALLDLQIKRDGNGVPLPLPMQPIENMHIDGFLPVIINIVPITDLPFLLGLDLPTQQENPVQLTYQELSLVVAPARERFYVREPDEVLI